MIIHKGKLVYLSKYISDVTAFIEDLCVGRQEEIATSCARLLYVTDTTILEWFKP